MLPPEPTEIQIQIREAIEDGVKTPEQLDHYIRCRENGTSRPLAGMLATRTFPGLRTDTTFNLGRHNGNQFENCPQRGDWLKREAEAAGVSVTGKYYMSGLAQFPGDPRAWVSDRSDVLRVAREGNLKVSGDVTYDPGEREPMKQVKLADDILDAAVDDYMAKDPGERREDVADRLRPILSGDVDLNPVLIED